MAAGNVKYFTNQDVINYLVASFIIGSIIGYSFGRLL